MSLQKKLVLLGFGFLKEEMIAGEIPWVTRPCLGWVDGLRWGQIEVPWAMEGLGSRKGERFFSQQFMQKMTPEWSVTYFCN